MLLTSGQVSAAISSVIVFVFTSILFLSGYALQQQSVRSIQIAIRPPTVPTASPSSGLVAQTFGHRAYSFNFTSQGPVKWKRTAYVQLVRDHLHVCNAAMMFATLYRQKSHPGKVLLYPAEWDREDKDRKDVHDSRSLDTTKRIIHKMILRYQVKAIPVTPLVQNATSLEQAYPISGLFSLTDFDRVMYLQSPGLIFDALALDELMRINMNSSALTFPRMGSPQSPITLLKPSMNDFHQAISSPSNSIPYNMTAPLPSEVTDFLYTQTDYLKTTSEDVDSSKYLKSKAFIRLSDPGIAGPDFDVPRQAFRDARPEKEGARRVWEELYERYRIGRMDVCGLDLEQIHTKTKTGSSPKSEEL